MLTDLTMINILIADDHDLFTDALVSLLTDTGRINVVATARNGEEAVLLAGEHPEIDVLVLDISMPVMNGIDALLELRRRECTIPALMLTQESTSGQVARALRAGAAGYVLKTSGRDEFITAIGTVAEGGRHISAGAQEALVARALGRTPPTTGPTPLTRREIEVLKLISAGETTNEIARQLFISADTVETHRRNLLQKLNVKNVAALVRYAVEHGLVGE
jgi:DNA-binding NarL/FixJ family response regulator